MSDRKDLRAMRGLRRQAMSNAGLHAIPDRDRLLTVNCEAGGSRTQPHVVLIVTREANPDYKVGDTPRPGDRKRAPCRCHAGGHDIDSAKLQEAVDRLRYRPAKARRVDARTLI